MAFSTVVISSLYEELINAIRQIARENGDFRLVMLISSEAYQPDEWNLILSATWLDSLSLRAALGKMLGALGTILPDWAFRKVQRVTILKTTERMVNEITADISVQLGTAYRVENMALSRFGIDEAVVLLATRNTAPAPVRSTV